MFSSKKFQPRLVQGGSDSSDLPVSDEGVESQGGDSRVADGDPQSNGVGDTRQEIIKTLQADIAAMKSMDEVGVYAKYKELISWDQDAKLYLGSRAYSAGPDRVCSLCWPNYVMVPMREAILNLLKEKLRKLKDEVEILPKSSE
jgi:hypothetical protein